MCASHTDTSVAGRVNPPKFFFVLSVYLGRELLVLEYVCSGLGDHCQSVFHSGVQLNTMTDSIEDSSYSTSSPVLG